MKESIPIKLIPCQSTKQNGEILSQVAVAQCATGAQTSKLAKWRF